MARFVGVDRGLKRLTLLNVSDVALEEAPLARIGESVEAVRRRVGDARWVLLLDTAERPEGWINLAQTQAATLSADAVDPSSPIVTFETTLRDALSMLLASAVQTAVVVDEHGRYAGVVTLDALGAAFRASPEPQAAGVA